MCSSVDYWRCRWIKLGGALEYPQRGPSDPHLEPDLSTVCPQGYPQGWRADPQGWRGGTRRCGGARASPRRRRGRRRAGPTGRSASRSPCGRAGPAPPLRLRLTAVLPRHRSPRAAPSARSPWTRSPVRHPLSPGRALGVQGGQGPSNGTRSPRAALSGRSRGGRSEAGGSCRDDAPASAPSGRPSRPGCSDGGHRRSAIADQDRVGVGGPPGSTRMRGGWVRRLGRGQLGGASGSTRARAVRWTPLHAGPSPHPSRSPRPSRRGRGRFGGGATRPLKKVAGADLSPSAPRSSRPEVAQ